MNKFLSAAVVCLSLASSAAAAAQAGASKESEKPHCLIEGVGAWVWFTCPSSDVLYVELEKRRILDERVIAIFIDDTKDVPAGWHRYVIARR